MTVLTIIWCSPMKLRTRTVLKWQDLLSHGLPCSRTYSCTQSNPWVLWFASRLVHSSSSVHFCLFFWANRYFEPASYQAQSATSGSAETDYWFSSQSSNYYWRSDSGKHFEASAANCSIQPNCSTSSFQVNSSNNYSLINNFVGW